VGAVLVFHLAASGVAVGEAVEDAKFVETNAVRRRVCDLNTIASKIESLTLPW